MSEPLESSSLNQSLQRASVELTIAFDATVEAFARAMELREGEPLGHTRQVTEVTANLARAMGITIPQLPHLRRGALLHDIGKLAVPESILKKTAPLTEEEWVVIRQHPQHAYDLLYPIVYLFQAIDIPYSHHEWWNGKGYPQGLKGEHIPIAARIFSVVDVWDALTSERPQRKAWAEKEALDYLRDQAGKQFDPAVVSTFLDSSIKKKVTRPLVK
jgi:HD-GYP domain-containing protein (c-di-GMP phosphodiesterase class II)